VVRKQPGRTTRPKSAPARRAGTPSPSQWLPDHARRFQALIEHSADSIALIDKDNRILYLSPAVTAVEGYSPEELLGRNGLENTHPDDLPLVGEVVKRLLAEPGRPVPVLWRRRHKSGRWLWLEGTATNLLHDPAVQAIVTNYRDITEQKRAEETLRASERLWRRAEGMAGLGHFHFDLRTGKVTGSAGLAQIYGVDHETLHTMTREDFGKLVHPDDREGLGAWRDALLEGGPEEHRHRVQRPDGSVREVELHAEVETDAQGATIGMFGVIQDVTARNAAEHQLLHAQKMEAVGQLAGGIAHDFNNLLGVVLGYCELAQRDLGSDHKARPRVDAIVKAAERAASLTRQILTFSRKQRVEPQLCDLNRIALGMETMLRRLIGEDVALLVAPGPQSCPLLADPGQLEQVIMNLAVNARDAMPKGGRLVIETATAELDERYVRTHPEARPGPHVELAVSDTGEGMSPETLSRIFEPFFTTKAPGQGTGLGLAVVFGIVKQNGGSLSVYSEPDRGTTFKVYFPRAPGPLLESTGRGAETRADGGTETVLVLEDEDALREVVCETLRMAGYSVLEAGHAEGAVLQAERAAAAIDLFVTDVVLPGAGGPQTAVRIRASHPAVKVLLMSGYTDRLLDAHRWIGPDTPFLGKPFTAEGLLRKVREVLDRGSTLP
jgi:two-component system cell cycle sensor histidine kinase/response regulator CckA